MSPADSKGGEPLSPDTDNSGCKGGGVHGMFVGKGGDPCTWATHVGVSMASAGMVLSGGFGRRTWDLPLCEMRSC